MSSPTVVYLPEIIPLGILPDDRWRDVPEDDHCSRCNEKIAEGETPLLLFDGTGRMLAYCLLCLGVKKMADYVVANIESAAESRTQNFLIWSNEDGHWWGPNHKGFTRCIGRAGRYTVGQAVMICSNRNASVHEGMEPNVVAVLAPEDLPSDILITENSPGIPKESPAVT